jgi:type II secretory pathway pseudopilin PulG
MGSANNRLIIAMIAVAALAGAFWMLLLSPKRQEATELDQQVTQARQSLSQHRSEVAIAVQARRDFPVAYQQLVVLGKAVPGDDDTPSLLVQLNRIAHNAKVRFQALTLNSGGGEETPPPAPSEASETPAPPTEVAASTLPLGATIGPAGLGVMPYTLLFKGNFFHLADFIKGLDKLVETENAKVNVYGRLLTIGGFSLGVDSEAEFPRLEATFEITAYVTPPSEESVTGEATPEGPASAEATPASTTTGGTP